MCGADRGPCTTRNGISLSLAVLNGPMLILRTFTLLMLASALADAQENHSVLLVVNDASSLSRNIGDYYAQRRAIPQANICHIRASEGEEISREVYYRQIAGPIAAFLRAGGLVDRILYVVTTMGVPLK